MRLPGRRPRRGGGGAGGRGHGGERSSRLRSRLGEVVVIPLWGALAAALGGLGEEPRERYQGEVRGMLEELREHNVFGGPTVWEDGHRPTEPRDGPFVRSTNHLCPSSAGWGGGGSPPPLDHSPARHSNPPFVRQRLPDQRNEWGIRAHHQSKLRRGVNLALRSRSNRTGFRLHRRRSDGGRRNVRPRVGKPRETHIRFGRKRRSALRR